jgi:hypothetical protein
MLPKKTSGGKSMGDGLKNCGSKHPDALVVQKQLPRPAQAGRGLGRGDLNLKRHRLSPALSSISWRRGGKLQYASEPPRLVFVPVYEIMVACILQKLDRAVGVGLQISDNDCWHFSTKTK